MMDRLSQVSMSIVDNAPIRFRELEELIRKVIANLPDDQREFFLMSREEGKTYREIAQEKNVSVKTVEKKMSKAHKTLNSELDNPLTPEQLPAKTAHAVAGYTLVQPGIMG